MSKKCIRCFIRSQYSIEDAWSQLELKGVDILYSEEAEDEGKIIYISCPGDETDFAWNSCDAIEKVETACLPEIDWSLQWQQHGSDFRDGYVHVNLREFNAQGEIIMEPGEGFGDLSHPTTYLALKLMLPYVTDQVVLDIGTGSGILALCAAVAGAKAVYGIDIDKKALIHARKNALLNEVDAITQFGFPDEYMPKAIPNLIVMNMIRCEQREALKSLSHCPFIGALWIVSGVLSTEREEYLRECNARGWQLVLELEKEGWLAFSFCSK